jgi:hypothetical protein
MTDESTKQDPAMNSIWSIGSDVRPNLKNNRKVKREITPLGKTGRLYIYIYMRQLPPKDPCQCGLVLSLVESSGFRCSRVAVFQPRESKRGTMTRFSFDDEPSPEISSLFCCFQAPCRTLRVISVQSSRRSRRERYPARRVLKTICGPRALLSSAPGTIVSPKRGRRTTGRTSVHRHVSRRRQVIRTIPGRTVGRIPRVSGKRSVSRRVQAGGFTLTFPYTFSRGVTAIARHAASRATAIRKLGKTIRVASGRRNSYRHHLFGFTTTFQFGHAGFEIQQFSIQYRRSRHRRRDVRCGRSCRRSVGRRESLFQGDRSAVPNETSGAMRFEKVITTALIPGLPVVLRRLPLVTCASIRVNSGWRCDTGGVIAVRRRRGSRRSTVFGGPLSFPIDIARGTSSSVSIELRSASRVRLRWYGRVGTVTISPAR